MYILVALKLDDEVDWHWNVILLPLFLLGVLVILIVPFTVFALCKNVSDYRDNLIPKEEVQLVIWLVYLGISLAIILLYSYLMIPNQLEKSAFDGNFLTLYVIVCGSVSVLTFVWRDLLV